MGVVFQTGESVVDGIVRTVEEKDIEAIFPAVVGVTQDVSGCGLSD